MTSTLGLFGRSTGYAQVSVTNVALPGTTVLDVTDPNGDDNGPGTYAYPTNGAFTAGGFDLTGLRVSQTATDVYIQTSIRVLAPTFGNAFGAQLLDIYVHDPAASSTSTATPGLLPLFDRRRRRLEPADRGAGVRRAHLADARPGPASAPGNSSSTTRAGRRR